MKAVEDAKASLEEKKASFVTKQSAREAAKESVKAAKTVLAEAADLQAKGDANHAALEKDKAAIDAAYQEHFKAPMDASEGPHYGFLMPFIKNLGLEDSLANALPSSCDKTKEQRGSFDDLVLAELGKALLGKIATLRKVLLMRFAGSLSARQLSSPLRLSLSPGTSLRRQPWQIWRRQKLHSKKPRQYFNRLKVNGPPLSHVCRRRLITTGCTTQFAWTSRKEHLRTSLISGTRRRQCPWRRKLQPPVHE